MAFKPVAGRTLAAAMREGRVLSCTCAEAFKRFIVSMNADRQSLRLLFVSSVPRWGGGERWMLDAAVGLSARGHQVELAVRPGAALVEKGVQAGLVVHEVQMGGDFDPRPIWRIHRILSKLRPHATFVNLEKELRYVSFASLPGPLTLIFPRRGSDDPLKEGWLQRYTYASRSTRVLTNSEHLAQQRLLKVSYLTPAKIRVIRSGVDLPKPVEDRIEARRLLRLPRQTLLFLHVGELDARKGQEMTLRMLARWRQQGNHKINGQKVVVAFLGTGRAEGDLRDLCHKLEVQEHVLWLGFRKNVDEYLAVADALILPSQREGVPWTLLEAMSHALPVIASKVSGIPELVIHEQNGLLVESGDEVAWCAAFVRILNDSDLRQQLGQRARQTILEGWLREDMLTELECLVYASLIRQRRGRDPKRIGLLVDRDGTLVKNVPYNGDPNLVTLQAGVGRALQWVVDAKIRLLLVSNQSGIARGMINSNDVERVHARIQDLLSRWNVALDGIYTCPHHPDFDKSCDCRKPQPGLLLQAAREHQLQLEQSLMVGDSSSDLEAGRRAGTMTAAYVAPHAEGDVPCTISGGAESGAVSYSNWLNLVRDFLSKTLADPD